MLLSAFANRPKRGTDEIKNLIKLFFEKLKEWFTKLIGKIGSEEVIILDTAEKTIEKISKTINGKLTEFYLIRYGNFNTHFSYVFYKYI